MPIYRVTFGFAGLGGGWTETHMMTSTQSTPLQAVTAAQAVQSARCSMLSREWVSNGIRVSAYSDGGSPAIRSPRSVWLDKTRIGPGGMTATWAGEPNPVSLQAIGIA